MNNKEHVVILLAGKTCSGKSTLAKTLCERTGLMALQSYTTRGQRNGNDNDHTFTTVEQYLKAKGDGEVVIDAEIAGNYYYATIDQLYSSDVYTINPEAIDRLLAMDLPNIRFVVVYVSCSDSVRETRALKRGDDKGRYRARNFSEKLEFKRFVQEEKWDYAIRNESVAKSYSVLRWIATVEGVFTKNTQQKAEGGL